jgi:hypothetical protein
VATWLDLGVGVAFKMRAGWSALAPLRAVWNTTSAKPAGVIGRIGKAVLAARFLLMCWENWRR